MHAMLLLLATLPLTACSAATAGKEIDAAAIHRASTAAACGAFKPIRYSKNDTEETRRQVRAHDAAGAAICGWKP